MQGGHKLRLKIPDTAVISGGVLQAWLQTNSKTGAIQSTPRCQLSCAALSAKLKGQHAAYDSDNPDGWVAVTHWSNGLSWLVDAAGLEQLVSHRGAEVCKKNQSFTEQTKKCQQTGD